MRWPGGGGAANTTEMLGLLSRVARGVGLLLLGWALGRGVPVAAREGNGFADALLFDGTDKQLTGTSAQTNFIFTFRFTNSAPVEAVVESVRTSCGCTVARVPPLPWTIPAGGLGEFSVALDVRGKHGVVHKSVFVNTSLGLKPLTVRVVLDAPPAGASGSADLRLQNMELALADRFAVFRGECAGCHAKPAEGKSGPALYLAVCAVCHDSANRASMVPDLKSLPHPTDREFWLRWITFGRHGSLMPAFAQPEGGPLTEPQVDSLADYLSRTISARGRPATPAPAPPTAAKIQ